MTPIIVNPVPSNCCKNIGNLKSSISKSFEKRDKNLPTGVVSKNHFGALKMFSKLFENIRFAEIKYIKPGTNALNRIM